MDSFAAIVLGGVALMFLMFLGLGWASRNKPVAEFLDKRANERWAAQLHIEESEIPQMVAASNEYRRKRGLPEMTVEGFKAKVGEEQRGILAEATKQLRAKASKATGAAREQRGL
jgi:FtsZ-interacting cell division protein ZipA